jgi:hypothetical protein
MSRSHLLSISLTAVFFAVGAAACSEDEEDSAEVFVKDYCNLLMPCCASHGFSSNPTSCEQFLNFAAMAGTYDGAKGDACLSAMRATTANDDYCETVMAIDSCQDVFASSAGSVQPGGACSQDMDCARTSEGRGVCADATDNPDDGGVCMTLVTAGVGATPCVGNDLGSVTAYSAPTPPPKVGYLCDDTQDAYCDFGTFTCAARKKTGEACDWQTECVADARCDGSSNLCVARADLGSPCSTYDMDSCVEGAYCSDQAVCEKKLPAGSPCTSNECEGNCASGTCEPSFDFGFAFYCGGA